MNPTIGFVTSVASDLETQLQFAGKEEFDYVEILMDGQHAHDRLRSQMEAIEDTLSTYGLDLVVHLPFPTDIGSPYEGIRAGAVETQKSCIDTASSLGAAKGVLHPESSAWNVAWDDETRRQVNPVWRPERIRDLR